METRYVVKYCGMYLYQNGNMFTIHKYLARMYKNEENAKKWITKNREDYYRTVELFVEEIEVDMSVKIFKRFQ